MTGWLPPTLLYVLLLGASGVTTKLALRTITWEQMVLWVPLAYLLASAVLLATGTRFPLGVGGAAGGAWRLFPDGAHRRTFRLVVAG